MNLRKLVSLTALLSFVLLLLTSVVLYIVPHGRVAYWSDWHFWGLSKTQWGALHINIGLLFLLAVFVHTWLNIKPIIAYLKNKDKKLVMFTPEFNGALIITVLFCLGTYYEIVPFKSVISFGESIKETAIEKYGEPPYGHAELSSLEIFTQKVDLDFEVAKSNLNAGGVKFTDGKQTILDIANQNQMTPKEVYHAMLSEDTETAVSALPSNPQPGLGKLSLSELCNKYSLDVSQVLEILNKEQIKAQSDMDIKGIAQQNKLSPVDVYTIIRNGVLEATELE